MKKVLAGVTMIAFGAFGIAVIGLLMSLTYEALGRIFPQSPTNQMWGLILFDIAAIVWFLAFIFQSHTVGQYAVSAIGFLVGFLGTLIMVAAEVLLGQDVMQSNAQEIGRWMVYGFIGATALHAALTYAHHVSGPELHKQIEIGISKGEVITDAIKQAKIELERDKTDLARTIKEGFIADAKRELGLYPVTGTPFEPPAMKYPYQDGHEPIISPIPHPIEETKDKAVKPQSPFQPE